MARWWQRRFWALYGSGKGCQGSGANRGGDEGRGCVGSAAMSASEKASAGDHDLVT